MTRPFTCLLIANRGEIACRIAATATRLGIRTVAVYSDADAGARHVRACDDAVHIGPPLAAHSYLDGDRLIAAAHASGAEAIHPGYGFLSEHAGFARACAAAGLVFVGPPPEAIEAMGSKATAKTLMAAAGVPLVPGWHGSDNDPQLLRSQAQAIGWPLLIKAVAGGGGRGMRRVDRLEDFDQALASCQREAQASFGNPQVLLERYLLQPRHIEVQVFADRHGHCLHLFERDCTVQRRHQKLLEEAPAPGLDRELRAAMGAAAVSAARAVGYVGAGTVEFIAQRREDGGLDFHFMEMNTRLQVEHPVTEAVTGIDLVEWQLRVAAGQPLPLAQHQVHLRGHAIEARICAENPDHEFLPAAGRLPVLEWPPHVEFEWSRGGAGDPAPAPVRVDAGFSAGDRIPPDYDSMIAKLIVWGEDRASALARLDSALRDTHAAGLATNVAFLRQVAASQQFRQARHDTGLVEELRSGLAALPGLDLATVVTAALASHLASATASVSADPWSAGDDWRLHGESNHHFDLRLGAQAHHALLTRQRDGSRRLCLDHHPLPAGGLPVAWRALGGNRWGVTVDGQSGQFAVHAWGSHVAVFGEHGRAEIEWLDPWAAPAALPGHGADLRAPMPGRIIALLVNAGDQVVAGQALVVMEAMKMEHRLCAPHAGTVSAILCAVDERVSEGAELVVMTGE